MKFYTSKKKRSFRLTCATVILTSAGLIGFGVTPVAAAVPPPSIDYDFVGNLTDSAGGSTATPSVTCPTSNDTEPPCITSSSFGSDGAGSFWQWSTTSLDGGGLRILTSAPVTDTYTLILKFSFSDIGPDADYRKIIDYKDSATDTGFYTYADYIYFYELGDGSDVVGKYFSADEVIDLVVVRDGTTDNFKVYIRSAGGGGLGDPVIDIDDSADNESVFATSGAGSVIGLFYDDGDTDDEGSPGGKVYEFKTWSGVALTEDQLNEVLGIQTEGPNFDFDDYELPQPAVASESLPNTGAEGLEALAVFAVLLIVTGTIVSVRFRRVARS